MFENLLRRAIDAVSDGFQLATARPDIPHLSRTKPNEYCQCQCKGCDEICEILRWGEAQRRRDGAFQGCPPSRIVHSSYLELDLCAGVSGCDTCRIIRRAFLLEQITGHDAERLEHPENQWPIHAVLSLGSADSVLLLTIKSPDNPLPVFSAAVQLSRDPLPLTRDDPTTGGARVRSDLGELRRVIDDCRHNHECASRYRWSRRNPTWLLKVLPNDRVQLIERPPSPVDYVVLSYSWGDPNAMPAAEWAKIKGAATRTIDGRPVPERLKPFPMGDLPETMQDAITITASLGFSHVWIDNICIPKGTNWDTEASLMHEVYGNAAFTLVASSSTKATDHMLHDRLAWTHRNKPCKLRGLWLHGTVMPLERVRFESPVSQRGWTLQEERLSPRILYWTGQRWYWSCQERQTAELSELQRAAPPAVNERTRSCPQRFLELCRTGDENQLHEEWLDIVEAYTRRDLVKPKDRFLAIAGLAVRFYNAKANYGASSITEEYLAGLWKDNFARHLAWAVANAVDPEHSLQHIAPSWSWASLPLRVHTRTKQPLKPSEHFKFIGADATHAEPTTSLAIIITEDEDEGAATANPAVNRGRAVEERGRSVKAVHVQGRFRRFIPESAHKVSWEAVERDRERDRGGPSFDFGAFPGQHVYARNGADGRLVAKEAHSGEVVGQLDYLVPWGCGDGGQGKTGSSSNSAPYVRDGREKDLVCLELGEEAMLLLVRHDNCGDGAPGRESESYRRVGVAIGYTSRKGFFYGCETRAVRLC